MNKWLKCVTSKRKDRKELNSDDSSTTPHSSTMKNTLLKEKHKYTVDLQVPALIM